MRWDWNSRHAKQASWLIATVMPKMRPCHASSKISSPFFLGSAAAPLMSAISRLGTGSIRPPRSAAHRWRLDRRHADHRVARHQRGQLGLAQALGAGRTLGEHQVAELRARVPDANLRRLRQVEAELAQDHARLTHRPRAVLERLVPDRRQADQRVRVAGAERANDQIVYSGRVLDHLEVDPAEAQLFDGLGPVGEEALA